VTGNYPEADGRERGGKATPAIRQGHNKDFRPDLKQLLFILTISADGALPIAYRVADGNTPDDVTHIPTWDELRALVGRPDFLYVADSKLCSKQAMGHIAGHGGRFVTIVPNGRREDTWFRDWAQTHAPAWTEARRTPGARQTDPDRVWRTFEAPAPSVDGYRVIWVHSSSKAARDAGARAARIEAGLAAVDAVAARLASPKTRIKTRVAAEQAASTALQAAGATRWVGFTITETTEVDHRQEKRGRPGAQTRYRRTEKTIFTITAAIHADKVSYDAVTDGCFPTITNDTVMTGAEVLAAYHYQPNLERRNHLLKGPQEVAPIYLETAHRIEALLLCHFLAMLTEALIEREIRTSMSNRNLAGIPLYPELRSCPAPSAPRILEIFDDVQRHQLIDSDGQTVQTFQPELTDLQQQVLDLLHIPASVYS
jgi:transposase